jgi:hypothetical protein
VVISITPWGVRESAQYNLSREKSVDLKRADADFNMVSCNGGIKVGSGLSGGDRVSGTDTEKMKLNIPIHGFRQDGMGGQMYQKTFGSGASTVNRRMERINGQPNQHRQRRDRKI